MNASTYLVLIEDTLKYLKERLPIKTETAPPSPPLLKKEQRRLNVHVQPPSPPLQKQQKEPPLSPPLTPPSVPEVFLKLEPPSPRQPLPFEMVRKQLQEIDPTLRFCSQIPNDSKAKQIKEGWKKRTCIPSIPILFQGRQYRTFITHLAKAIDTVYSSCHVIDVVPNQDWSLFLASKHLTLILALDKVIFESPALLSLYREIPQKNVRTLGNTPLLLLPNLSLYMKDPSLKRSLWNVICNTLNSLQSS